MLSRNKLSLITLLCAVLLMLLCACGTIPEPLSTPSPVVTPEPTPAPAVFSAGDCRPIIKDGKYVYNPCLLTEECIAQYGEGFAEVYKGFIEAIMSYETSCPCSGEEYAKALSSVLSYECAFLAQGDIELNWATGYDYEAKSLSWTYNISKTELAERIEKVASAMQSFLDLISASDDEADKMQTVYHAFCPLMTYDHDAARSRQSIDACFAYTEHRGICVTFATALVQIMSQADMTATQAAGNTDDGGSHVWDYIRVNGKYYFFDPTFELSYFDGGAFAYYGMTMAEREESGIREENMWIGVYESIEPQLADKSLFVK